MDPAEELKQIATWFTEEGLAPDSPKEAQLGFLWRALQHTRGRLSSVTRELETHRSQHLAEMAEVRKSLEQIRIFTEHKDVLAQEIQDENDQLKNQLRRLISLQDAQISEVAKMLYQQGLTELIHSCPSEQVAYLLVERASLLESSEGPGMLTAEGNTTRQLGTEALVLHTNVRQGAPRQGQSTWKRLFGLHKASQSKHTFIPAEARHLAGQGGSLERECSRLERDLEEGSRRLAMAHSEIRRLTDELESAHLTQRAYEPELQSAQQEVEHLHHEVEKLKKYEMAELRKGKELNDRLDFEIRTLRGRVCSMDAEKSSLQQMVKSLQEEVKQLESDVQKEQLKSVQLQANQASEVAEVQSTELAQNHQTCRNLQEKINVQTRLLMQNNVIVESLQKEVERLKSDLQLEAHRANKADELRVAELKKSNQTCKDLQNTIQSLQDQLDNSHNELVKLRDETCARDKNLQDEKMWKQQKLDSQLCEKAQQEDSFQDKEISLYKECPDYQEAMKSLLSTQDECETLKEEICETLKCLDRKQSKYHEMKERHKAKLCRAKQRFADVTACHNERINNLERELSLCSHSLTKEKELVKSMNVENEKLLCERRKLLQQLDEEEHSKKDIHLSALLSKRRGDFLEAENKKLQNKILHLSNQVSVLQRSLHNLHSLHFTEELRRMLAHPQVPRKSSSSSSSEPPPIQLSLHGSVCVPTNQLDVNSSPHRRLPASSCRPAEMGYLNLNHPDPSTPSDLSNTGDMV